MAEVKRKKGETFESLLRRFNKKIIQSGKVLQAKKIQYQKKEKSRPERNKTAVRRIKIREQKEYLRKIGMLKDEDNQNFKKR